MSINNITTDFTGEVGVHPRLVRIETTDSFAAITTENYLKNAESAGYVFYPNDAFLISYGTNSATTQLFTATISGGNITLVPSYARVTLPTISGKIVQFDDTTGTIGNGPVNANVVLTSSISTPDVAANLIAFNVTATAAQLASGGTVTLVPSSGSKQYRILSMYMNAGGTDFSGGGGDRFVAVTDGTTQYAAISDANLGMLVNAPWSTSGGTFSSASSTANSAATAPGASLVLEYLNGTTDFATGAITITGLVQRVA